MSKIVKVKTLIKAQKQKLSYVFINVAMAMLGFVRSYITMKYLGFYDVGLLAMVMSVIEFVSMFQFGLLNGGFRMFFVNTASVNKKINSMLFSYFGLLTIVLLVALAIYIAIKGTVNLQLGMIALGAIIGVVSLIKNWISNLLIAAQKLAMLNRINIWSTLISFIFIFFVPSFGLIGSILLIISQPVIFTISALWLNPEFRPKEIFYSKVFLRKLMFFGFIPFLAGILVKVDDQVERWGIIDILGVEDLGKYNLVLIYCSLFMLVPASINPIFYPKAILEYKNNNYLALKKTLKQYILTLFAYTVVAICFTILLLPYTINLLLPKYNVGVQYVWYIIPYLVAQMLVMPLDFIYTLTAKYRVMFVSYIFAVLLFVVLIFVITTFSVKKLEYFAIAKSLDGAIFVTVSYLGYYFFLRKKFFNDGLITKI